MKTILGMMCAFLVVASTYAEEKPVAKFDDAALKGTWTTVKGWNNGNKVEEANLEGDITFEKGVITIKSKDITHKMSFKIDPKGKPMHIDMEGLDGPAKGFTTVGIIEVEKDSMKLAYAFPGGKRPTAFESKKDSMVFYFELKKKK
ncbi:MAG: TIGR03067 domain-containing protein [Zavarzinella sp.]